MTDFWKRTMILLMVVSLTLGVFGTPVLAGNTDKDNFPAELIKDEE